VLAEENKNEILLRNMSDDLHRKSRISDMPACSSTEFMKFRPCKATVVGQHILNKLLPS
jgi:hypothetical protein